MRNAKLLTCLAVLLLASPALAGDKKKKGGGGGDEEAPPPAAEPAPKKNKHKDKARDAAPEPAPAAPAPPGTGTLKPGQAVGTQTCRGSANNVNIEATSKYTIGVATCRGELQKMFIAKGLCTNAKGKKIDYSWQFADTTGTFSFTCT